MSYQPFPIYDFRTGLKLDKEPWLQPGDAFKVMLNAYLRRGVLHKRLGYSLFATEPDSTAVLGICQRKDISGSTEALIFSPTSGSRWDAENSEFFPITGATFNAGLSNRVSSANWNNYLYTINCVDPLTRYDGTEFEVVDTSITEAYEISTALLVFQFKERLILLWTIEDDITYPRRARWCSPGNPTDWTNDEYLDAPTDEWIMGACLFKDYILVFFEQSIWALQYTGDPDLPFRWERLLDTDGSYAPFSVVGHRDNVYAMSAIDLIATNGMSAGKITSNVPDIVLGMAQDRLPIVTSVKVEEYGQIWWAYPQPGNEQATHILCYNYEDRSFSQYDIPMMSLALISQVMDPTWDDMAISFDDSEFSWDDRIMQGGFAQIWGGDQNGNVYSMNSGRTDNGNPILFDVRTVSLNPYINQGMRARLGYVDFLVDAASSSGITVDFYVDESTTPYFSTEMDFEGTSPKVWKRVYVNAEGITHEIRLWKSASNQTIRIHAIVPHFKQAGRIT